MTDGDDTPEDWSQRDSADSYNLAIACLREQLLQRRREAARETDNV